jgi:flagellar basal-body rod protein FlgG
VPNAAKQGNNLFVGAAAGRATGVAASGKLEDSGVDPASTMVHMISALQSYDAGQKVLQTLDQTMQHSASSVGSVGGGG